MHQALNEEIFRAHISDTATHFWPYAIAQVRVWVSSISLDPLLAIYLGQSLLQLYILLFRTMQRPDRYPNPTDEAPGDLSVICGQGIGFNMSKQSDIWHRKSLFRRILLISPLTNGDSFKRNDIFCNYFCNYYFRVSSPLLDSVRDQFEGQDQMARQQFSQISLLWTVWYKKYRKIVANVLSKHMPSFKRVFNLIIKYQKGIHADEEYAELFWSYIRRIHGFLSEWQRGATSVPL